MCVPDDSGMLVVAILIRVIFGAICAAIASSKGRSAVGWFFCGFFIAIIGIIIIACLSNLTEQQNYRSYVEMENRRLREQLYQERIKADSFRAHTQARLDMHDQTLGVDTRAAAMQLQGGQAGPAGYLEGGQLPPIPVVAAQPVQAMWYYECMGQTNGPVSADIIRTLYASGQLQPTNLVWCEGMPDWTPLERVPEFNAGRMV